MQSNEQAVRERAYYIWEGEGRVHGRAHIHWLRAEAELSTVEPAKKPARKAAEKPAVKAETVKAAAKPAAAKPATAKPAAKAKSIEAAVPPLPGRKAAKPKVAPDAAVAASAGKAKPARGRASLH